MKRYLTSTIGALCILALGGAGASTAFLAREQAVHQARVAADERAGLELAEVRLELTAAITDLGTTRIWADSTGRSADELQAATSRWSQVRHDSLLALTSGRLAAAGEDRLRLQRVLVDAGPVGPEELGPFLNTYASSILEATLAPATSGSRRVPALEAAVMPVNELIARGAYVQKDFAAAELASGLDHLSDDLQAYLVAEGVQEPGAGEVLAPTAVLARTVTVPGAPPYDPAGSFRDLMRIDPALAETTVALATGVDGANLLAASNWSELMLKNGERTARPVTAPQVATGSRRLTAVVRANVSRALHQEGSAADARAKAARDEAAAWQGATWLVVVVTCGALVWVVLRRRREDRLLSTAAMTDSLTGLANRRALEIDAGSRFTTPTCGTHVVMALDLDGFKYINDTFGHATGDEVLSQVAQRCRAVLRSTDVIARTGGDEFIVVLFDLEADDVEGAAHEIAEAMENTISEPVSVDAGNVRVGVSIGVALRSGHTHLTDAIASADSALYEVKNSRPGRHAPAYQPPTAHVATAPPTMTGDVVDSPPTPATPTDTQALLWVATAKTAEPA